MPGPVIRSTIREGRGKKTIALCSDSSQCAVGWRCLGGFCYPPEDTPGSLNNQDEDQGCGSTSLPSDGGGSSSGGSLCGGGVSSTPSSCSRPTCGVGGTPEDFRPDGGTGYKDGEPEGGYVSTGRSTDAATYGGGYSTSSASYYNSCGGGFAVGRGGGGRGGNGGGGGGGGGNGNNNGGGGGNPPGVSCSPFCDGYSKANGSSSGGCEQLECNECSTCNQSEGVCESTIKTCNCPGGEQCGKCYVCSNGSCVKSSLCKPPPEPPPPSPPQPPTECQGTSVCDFSGGNPSCPSGYDTVGEISAGGNKCVICERCEEDCRVNGCPDCFDCKPTTPGSSNYSCKAKQECGGNCPEDKRQPMSLFGPLPGHNCASTVFYPSLWCRVGTLNIDCGQYFCSAQCLDEKGCFRNTSWAGTMSSWRCSTGDGGSAEAQMGESIPRVACSETLCD